MNKPLVVDVPAKIVMLAAYNLDGSPLESAVASFLNECSPAFREAVRAEQERAGIKAIPTGHGFQR
ncbi:hypothetical protein ACIPMW_15870 [Streptomyces sp. NPDC086669]|uniref:hypothetical protein n=1 Tax=Streptomyces sp. NPDC086669 TaxID=3365753 RepID=UPI003805AE19